MEKIEIATAQFGEPVSVSHYEWKFVCPICAHKALSVDPAGGMFFCFVCEYGRQRPRLWGGPIEQEREPVDEQLHRSVRIALFQLATLSKPHREYLRSRGVYNPERYGIKSVPPQVEKTLLERFSADELVSSGFFRFDIYHQKLRGWPALRFGRILIPTIFGRAIHACKTREDPYDPDARREDVKYSVPRGSKPGHFLWFIDAGHSMLVTEGELKAAAACEHGFPTVSFSGITSLKHTIPQLESIVKSRRVKRLFVVFDSEEDPEKDERSTAMGEKVVAYFPKIACNVKLPKRGTRKVDLDSFLVAEGEKELESVLEDAWEERFGRD